MKKPRWSIAWVCLAILVPLAAHAQPAKPRATVGLYYFDGWSGKTDKVHLPKLLQTEFADRKPVHKLIERGQQIFDQFAENTPLPYVPVITAGWDRRPWEKGKLPPEKMSSWYPDRTPQAVEDFVRRGVGWLDKHPDKATPERLLLIYAWNENGEGGYLTPTAKDGAEYLKAVQRAIGGDADHRGTRGDQ